MNWFRLYDSVLDDPKVQLLPPELRWRWIECLCISSRNSDRGYLPSLEHVAFHLKLSMEESEAIINWLTESGLIEKVKGSKKLRMHNWENRQFKTDVSTDRVKRFRQRSRNVSATPNETPQKRLRVRDTETETETEQKTPPNPLLGEGASSSAFEPTKPIPEAFMKLAREAEVTFADTSWGLWVVSQFHHGERGEDVAAALTACEEKGKRSISYAAGVLRRINAERAKTNGRP